MNMKLKDGNNIPVLDIKNANAPTMPTVVSEGELFKKILGAEWLTLHPEIQARFARNPLLDQPLYYTGTLSELRCSWFGRILGYLTMPMIKGALLPFNDQNFPVDIEVYSRPGSLAIFKQRIYRLHGRAPIQFTSFMLEGSKGEVLEYVGMGLGMKLLLRVQDGDLYFTSDGYFWEIFGRRLPLPALLTPGKTFLCHRNETSDKFNIRIEIRHPWFGTSFVQAGQFREVSDSATSITA